MLFRSLYITFGTFAACMVHNITLLALTFREQKGKRILRAGMLPATATQAAWISAVVLAVCWCATIAVLLVSCAGVLDDGRKRRPYQKVMPWLEWIFASFEVVTLGAFVVGSVKERRAVLAAANSPAPGRWDALASATSLQSA